MAEERFFVVFERAPDAPRSQILGTTSVSIIDWNNDMYRRLEFAGCTYSEASLRRWANSRWGVALDAPISEIATNVAKGGWSLMERINPA